jgi:hypothetical protein
MSSVAEVAAELRAIAGRLPLPLVHQADDDMREAAELMSEVGQGSTQQGLYDATAAFACARTEIQDLLRTLASAGAALLAAADRLSSGGFGQCWKSAGGWSRLVGPAQPCAADRARARVTAQGCRWCAVSGPLARTR